MKPQQPITLWFARLLLLAGLAVSGNLHAEFIYTVSNSGGLGTATHFGKIDTSTGAYTDIASLSQGVGNLAYNPVAGDFYVTEGDQDTAAVTLRTLTTAGNLSSAIGTIGKSIYGMAYRASDSTLYAYAYNDDDTGKINPATGAWTALNTSPGTFALSPVGGRWTLLDGNLYAAVNSSLGARFGTYGFDAVTNFAQIGNINSVFANMVLATDGTSLYGLYANGTDGNQQLYTIDPSTGGLTPGPAISGSGLGIYFHGAAFGGENDIPEPPTLLIALFGLPALWVSRRRSV